MGPNGSGKSTLSNVIMGHPSYKVEKGQILFKGEDITNIPVHERARKKIFLAFQYPSAVPGVTVGNFIRAAYIAQKGQVPFKEFRDRLKEQAERLKVDEHFLERYVNDGFSGGEKKKAEILQLAMLMPSLALLDETDSGLDIDALKLVSEDINAIKTQNLSLLIVTHYQRILSYIKPDVVHIMYAGQIIETGGAMLAEQLEKEGYEKRINAYKNATSEQQ